MNHRRSPDAGEAHPIRAFQTDPCWYESYWYPSQRHSTRRQIRHSLAAMPALIRRLRGLIVERSTEPMPVPRPQNTG